MSDKWLNITGFGHYNRNLKRYYARSKNGHTMLPVYQGDYIPAAGNIGCCLRIDNMLYCIDAYDDSSNSGYLNVFDLSANQRVPASEKTIRCHHANSICYNKAAQRIYIAPVFDYSTSPASSVDYLLVYDNQFNYLGTITPSAGSSMMGVTYDSTSGSMYAIGYNAIVYKYDAMSNTFTEYCSLPGLSSYYVQDAAAFNDYLFISGTTGAMLVYTIQDGKASLIDSTQIGHMDNDCRFWLGEPEGMEFDEDGRLWCANLLKISPTQSTAFITVLPVGFANEEYTNGIANDLSQTVLYINDASVNAFRQERIGIRSINQLEAFIHKPQQIVVAYDQAEPEVVIRHPVTLAFQSDYTMERLTIRESVTITHSGNPTITITQTTGPIAIADNGSLNIGGAALRVSTPNISGTIYNLITLINTPYMRFNQVPVSTQGMTPYVSGTAITRGCYIGTNKFISY